LQILSPLFLALSCLKHR